MAQFPDDRDVPTFSHRLQLVRDSQKLDAVRVHQVETEESRNIGLDDVEVKTEDAGGGWHRHLHQSKRRQDGVPKSKGSPGTN
jgi:hypothetical protein